MERVRFAPSPTGPLHIGGLRTALFNYLYARKNEGVFILRVEDTDLNRKVEGSEDYIHESLAWCGITPDEDPVKGGAYGPYRQSERKAIYKSYIQELIDNGKAYYAFDSNEELAAARAKDEKEKGGFKYNYENRHLFDNSIGMAPAEIAKRVETEEHVVRLKVSRDGEVVASDLVRGTIRVDHKELEDKILLKKDQMPTYHFANVVDDFLMKITTVIRGEEWLPSLPIHQLLYEAFGWTAPNFMHLPLILNPSGKGKLSKRDGDKNGYPVFPIQWGETVGYREAGFLPEAHINYIAQLGWRPKQEKEIMSLKEMEVAFSVEGIQKGGARFDYEKAKWLNQQYLQKMEGDQLVATFPKAFEQLKKKYGAITKEIVELIHERLVLLADIEEQTKCFLYPPEAYDEKSLKKITKGNVEEVLKIAMNGVEEHFDDIKTFFFEEGKNKNVGLGQLMQVLRLACVGSLSGPDLLPMMKIIGQDVTFERLDRLIKYIN